MKQVLNKVLGGISYALAIIGMVVACWSVPTFLFCSPSPAWKELFICIVICVICFGQMWLKEKIRRSKLTPEEREREDFEEKEKQRKIDKARAQHEFGRHSHDSWIARQAKEDDAESKKAINDFIYQRIDEMIEQTDDPDTKIMLLKKKNEFLQEDIRNQNKQ